VTKLVPYVAIALLIAGLSAMAYSAGYNKAEKRYEAALNDVLAAARAREQDWVDHAMEREKASKERLQRFKVQVYEQSNDWAVVDVPVATYDGMHEALCPLSAGACRPVD
jgi:hypothetical protein